VYRQESGDASGRCRQTALQALFMLIVIEAAAHRPPVPIEDQVDLKPLERQNETISRPVLGAPAQCVHYQCAISAGGWLGDGLHAEVCRRTHSADAKRRKRCIAFMTPTTTFH